RSRGGRPSGRLREHAEDRRLVETELAVSSVDAEDDLLRRDHVAVVKRLDLRLGRVAVGENVTDEILRLVDPAQDGVLPREDLHRHDGIEALALHDAGGSGEIDVRRITRENLPGGPGSGETHQAVHGHGASPVSEVGADWPV